MIIARVIVALAWILGAGSLLLFGSFLWTGAVGPDFSFRPLPALLWDASLCIVFFAQHSILIRRPVRNALRRAIPDHFYGLAYTYSSALALVLLVVLWQHAGGYLYAVYGAGRWVLRIILLLAFVGVLWGIRSLERFDAFGANAYLNHLRQRQVPPGHLTVKGPYGLVRHPFYAFGIVALWATPALSVDRLLLNVLFTGWILLGASLEERDLHADFGEEYAHYRESVPMFVPRLSKTRTKAERATRASGNRAA
jgi:methanethiol S-methyltransferase